MPGPLVSFVVPCYNYGRYLRDCLDGIFGQEGGYEDIEVIAINDCSPDNTKEILQGYQDVRLRVIDHEVNRGHVFTVNEGLQQARGKYLVRIDPDDRHHRHFLAKTVPLLEQHAEVGLVYGNINLINAEGVVTQERADSEHGGRDFKGNELIPLMRKNFICAPTVIARREAWMEAWPVPDGLAFNDWYFNLMLARRWEFCYVDEVLADYRVHGANWHSKISADGSEERSVLWLLDKVYAETETDAALEQAKQSAKGQVYAAQYLDFALKYFGHGMNRESRRCLLRAAWNRPTLLGDARVLRYLTASFLPRSVYDGLKKRLRGLPAGFSS